MSVRQTTGRGRLFENVVETMGNTPAIRINRIGPKNVTIYVKVEAFNPLASVKDRLAVGIIEAAERSGALKPGQTVVEATSGNTGIGLAMVCAAKGYPLVCIMADSFSVERRKLMRFLGAKVILTPRAQKAFGMMEKLKELVAKHGWFNAAQFETSANAEIHENTTAREILGDFGSTKLDYFVSGYGTGGTLTGIARVLRKESPATKIILAEPGNAGLVASGVAQPRHADHTPSAGHPSWQPHPMQGWTPDIIPWVLQEAIDGKLFDQLVQVDGPASLMWSRRLAAEEGIFCGISSGGTFAAAVKVAVTAPEGSTMLVMLPDTGERYLSTPLFEGIEEVMTEEEREIMRSTPGCQFEG